MKTMSLRMRLLFGFGLVACVALVLGSFGVYSAHRNQGLVSALGEHHLPAAQALLTMKEAGTAIKSVQRTLLNQDLDSKVYVRQFNLFGQSQTNYEQGLKVYGGLPRTAEEEKLWQGFKSAWEAYRKDNQEFLKLAEGVAALRIGNPLVMERELARFRGDHYKLLITALEACNRGQPAEGGTNAAECGFGKWQGSVQIENEGIRKEIKAASESHSALHAAMGRIHELLASGQAESARKVFAEELTPAAHTIIGHFDRMLESTAAACGLVAKMNVQAMEVCRTSQLKAAELLDQLVAANLKSADTKAHEGVAAARFFQLLSMIMMGVGLTGAMVLAFFLARSITGPIREVAEALTSGAEQTVAAAAQVSAASEGLAEGASEQAASLEETSSSLEEMSSMTKRNADNAGKANALARQARQAAEAGTIDMSAMATAMAEIKASSDDIAKILRSIDEIAFQTNILALNAAVEAARAGEAGMGFAVVADEVRNLAQRSAQSAKETAEKIEVAISRTAQGETLSQKVAQALEAIVDKVRQVDALAAEVAAASAEQSQGVEQINTAVSQVDKVTQNNAASAEESAAASEQLNAQAESVLQSVGRLQSLVDGGQARRGTAEIRAARLAARNRRRASPPRGSKLLAGTAGARGRPGSAAPSPALAREDEGQPVAAGAAD